MNQEDLFVLEKQDDTTLAEWYCKLNYWEWPVELPNPMTQEERNTPEYPHDDRGWKIMCWIKDRVGQRLVSYTWNKDKLNDVQFNDFYRGTYEGDLEAKRRYERWLYKIREEN